MTLSYNLSHHGGNSTHSIWIKYFTMKCEIKDVDVHLQTPIDQFLISVLNYHPADIRNIKKEIKKSRNQTELEQNLAELFLFNEINIGNVFAFSRFMSEKNSSCSTPTNLELIPQYLMRGYIAFSYRFKELFNQYINKEKMENFQEEFWELFHYPLQYLFKEPNAIFKETVSIILPIFENIDVKTILDLEDSNFLKIGLNLFISTLINCFPLEQEFGSTHIFNFLIQTLIIFSNFSKTAEIMNLFGLFFQKLETSASIASDEQSQQIFNIFINVMKSITNKENDQPYKNSVINFSTHSLNSIPSFIGKYSNEQIIEIVQSILSFLLWTIETIPYEKMFQSVGEYQLFTNKAIEVKYNDWFSYFTDNILLPEKFTKQIKSARINNILNALFTFFKYSLQSLSIILDDFLMQIIDYNENNKYLILIFIFISLIKVKDLDITNIKETFILSNIYDTAFPTDLTVQIQPIALHYHEVFLKFLYYFMCYKAENLQMVLRAIGIKLMNKNFEKMAYFLPLLRSLLLHDSQIQFIHYFLGSGIIENIHSSLFVSENNALVDQVSSFYQLISITRPMEVFYSTSFLLALRNLVMIDRLQQLLAPCFKIGMSLSFTTPFNVGKKCVHYTLEQVFSILKQASKDLNYNDLVIQLVTYMIETVELIDVSVFNDLGGLFEEISKVPSYIQTSDAFLKCLTFLNKFCAHHPEFIKFVNSNNSVIIRNFESSAPKIKMTQEIIDCLIAFMLNDTEIKESKIKNRAALRLLLQISKETEFENSVLNFLLKKCTNSMFNNFECFSCDVIGFVLSRLCNHLQLSLELFKVIGSKFFSPLALNQTFKAMRLENGKRCIHHQKLLDTFYSMLLDCRLSPVTSFFHFGGDEEGVVVGNIDPVIFSEPYSIASLFKIEKFEEKFYPILSISENGKNSLLSFFMKSDMFVVGINQHPGYVLRKDFIDSNWYKLIVVINPACIQIFINDAELGSIPIAKHDFRNEVTVVFGKKDQNSFCGDFGPTIFIKSTNLQEINEIYQKVNLSRVHIKSAFIKFLPWLVKNDKISDVVLDNDSYPFSGDAIPSCTTIAQMIHFEGTFPKFLPLFVLLNYPVSENETCVKDEDENNSNDFANEDEQFFVSVLQTFVTLLKISERLQKSFEKIGGFKLLAGFISHMRSEIFTAKIANHFESIFNVLTLKSLQNEMIEQIWLNFDLWSSMSSEFQLAFYTILDKIWMKNRDLFVQKITASSLLYQCSFYEISKSKRKLMFFDLDKQVDNVPIEVKNDQKQKIEKLQWKFLFDYAINNPSVSSYVDILMILSHHNDHRTQIFASEIIEISLKKNINEFYVATALTDEYVFFLNIFANSKTLKLKANIMRCIFMLGVNERKGKIVLNSMKFNQALHILIQLLNTVVKTDKDKAILFKVCFSFLFENYYSNPKPNEISNPEALLPAFALSGYIQKEELVKYSLILLNDFAQYSDSVLFLLSIDSWPIWSFIFAYNTYDIEKDCHTFAYFFSIFFNSALTNSRIDLINSFVIFLDVLSMYVITDLNLIKKDLIMHLILYAVQHKLDLDVLTNLLIISLRFLFIKFEFDIQSTEELSNVFLLNLVQKNQSPSSIEEIKNQNLRVTFKEIDKESTDYVIEVLSLISSIISIKHDSQIEFDGILVDIFDIFSYLYLILDQSNQETIKIRAQSYFAQVSSSVSASVLDKFTTFSKEEFFNCMQKPDVIKESYHSTLVEEVTKISNSIQSMIQKPEDLERMSQSLKKFEASYNCFVDVNSNASSLTSFYNENMMISFIRFVTGGNGPWSTKDLSKNAINRWRATTKINENGHNIYWKLNRTFDDHKKASLLRDSLKIQQDEEQKLDIIPNFNRILIQNSPHIAMAKTEMKQETTISFKVTQFTLLYHISGSLYVSDRRIFFNGSNFVENLGDPENIIKERPHKFIEIPIHRISFVFQRRHQHCDVGAEIFTITNKSYLFIFESKEKRTDFLEIIKKMTTFDKTKSIQSNSLFAPMQIACGCCSQTTNSQELVMKSKITKMWQEKKITNFIYLLYLNLISGRSFNDISQYPVYPWILSDYESDQIDLNDPKVYRDLSKPIGAYNEERLEMLQKNMDMEEDYQQCLYRTFFSNPSSVAGYLIRTEPYTTLHIRLQGNKFDLPTRLFTSVQKAWDSVTGKVNDFRELIPEFFCSEHFLINENGFDLGKNVNDVELPNWASSPHEFIAINRIALESDFVSSHIESWIDLIFGIDQISVEKNNIYHLFSYTENLPDDIINDPELFFVAQNHALNFGVCPSKLFKEAHPSRNINEVQITSFPHSNSNSNISSLLVGKPPLKPPNTVSIGSLTSLNRQQQQSPQLSDIIKRDNSIEFSNSNYQIPLLDSPVACIRKGCVLTTKPTLFNISMNSVQHLVGVHSIKEGQLVDFDGTFLYEVSRGGTSVSVISIKTCEEVGILPHNNYEVTCISCIENRAILVCGTDCAIDIWKVVPAPTITSVTSTVSDASSLVSTQSDTVAVAVGNSIVYLGTITSHSMPIVTAVGNSCLDIIVSVDEGLNIVISTLRERKFIHSFKADCSCNSVLFLKVLSSGIIVLSSHVPGGKCSTIFFFDLRGNTLEKIQNDSCIEALDVICTKEMNEFVVVTTSSKLILIYECAGFKLISHFNFPIIPRFMSFVEQDQRAILIIRMKQKKYELSVVEF